MKNVLVIAAREFEEKRFVAYAAVSFAALPFLIAAIPMIRGRSSSEVIVTLAVILATGFTAGLAVITGAGLVGRDLSEGRMSFYFSRPVGAMSIWFGKLTAGLALIVGGFGLIAAPAYLIGGGWKSVWDVTFTQLAAIVLPVAVALFLISHAIGTFARSRSRLIAFDFAAAVICGIAVRLLVLPLIAGLATTLVNGLLIGLAFALLIGIVAGGAWQLERGRTDRRRNHIALSQFLWSVMAAALLIAAAFVGWVASVRPSDLTTRVHAWHTPGSRFLVVAGEARHRADYKAAFLVDVQDGSSRRIGGETMGEIRFARDGNSAIVVRPTAQHSADLVVYRRATGEPAETGLTLTPGDQYFVSDDGNRIALISNGLLSIYDVPQRRSLTSVRISGSERVYYRGSFVTPDLFRFYAAAPDVVSIMELDAKTRTLRSTGAASTGIGFSLDSSALRMLARLGDGSVTLNDARSGVALKTVVSGTDVFTKRFLRDGRIVVVDGPRAVRALDIRSTPQHAGGSMTLHVFSAEGVLLRDIPLDGAPGGAIFVGDDGTRLVLWLGGTAVGSRSLVAINLERGVIERRESSVIHWITDTPNSNNRPPLAPLREVFYSDGEGHLAGWSPATGVKRPVIGG